MNDTILVPRDAAQGGIRRFVEQSALAHCTTMNTEERIDGALAVTTSWPVVGFSTGEQEAWVTLRSLVNGELRGLLLKSGVDTIWALVACLALVAEEVTV